MSATIRFEDGTEATLSNEDGIWECADPVLKEMLDNWTSLLPYDHYIDPIGDLARKVAADLHAKVVYADPPPKWDPNAIQ